jgi:Flp pilus assembly pilin Flp
MGWFKNLGKDELGASLVEYALLLALIAVVAITALIFLGGSASNQLNNVANHLQ